METNNMILYLLEILMVVNLLKEMATIIQEQEDGGEIE
jgi:hypothetical protein